MTTLSPPCVAQSAADTQPSSTSRHTQHQHQQHNIQETQLLVTESPDFLSTLPTWSDTITITMTRARASSATDCSRIGNMPGKLDIF